MSVRHASGPDRKFNYAVAENKELLGMTEHAVRQGDAMGAVAMIRNNLVNPSEPFILDQARYLTRHRPIFISRTTSDPSRSLAPFSHHDMESMNRWHRFSYPVLGNPVPLQRLLSQSNATIAHAHFGPEGLSSLAAARNVGIPLVVSLYGFDVTVSRSTLVKSKRPSLARYAFGREKLFRSATTFVCVSEYIRERAVRLGLDIARSEVIPVGVNTAEFLPTPVPACPVVVHVARLVEKKGTSDLIRAFKIVRSKIPEARLEIVGDGPLRSSLELLVGELGLTGSVSFLGMQERAASIDTIRRGALFCLPSVTAASGDQEGLPQVILEAGALGRPVIATNHSGIPEGVKSGESARLVSERDYLALADEIIQVLSSHSLAQSMGDKGREYVVENFDVRSQVGKLEALYERIE